MTVRPCSFRTSRRDVVQGRIPQTDEDHIFGLSPGIQAIHIDIRQSVFQRIQRIFGVIFRAQQALLLGGYREEQDGAFGRGLQFGIGACDFQQPGAAGGVIDRSVIDLIALEAWISAEVIPVRRVDHVLVFARRIAAFELRHHVVRVDRAQGVFDM